MSETQAMTMYKTPKQTLLVVMKAGVAKGLSLWWQLLALGFHAGMFIGFGAGLVIAIVGALDSTVSLGFKKLVAGVIFPVCLILIVISGAELFTGNVMYMLTARMANQTTWKALVKNWFFSYFGNLCGCLCIAFFLFHLTDLFKTTAYETYLHNLAISKTEHNFGIMVLKGLGCNYLVCLALWCSAASDDILSKMMAIWWPIMAFVCIGFEHSIANMFYVPLAIMNDTGDVTAARFIVKNLIPVTIGNICGGSMFAMIQYLIYHPYVAPEVREMHVRQGHKKTDDPAFAPKKAAGKAHIVPSNQDSIFRHVADFVWLHYCDVMQNVFGVTVYTAPAPSTATDSDKAVELAPTAVANSV